MEGSGSRSNLQAFSVGPQVLLVLPIQVASVVHSLDLVADLVLQVEVASVVPKWVLITD